MHNCVLAKIPIFRRYSMHLRVSAMVAANSIIDNGIVAGISKVFGNDPYYIYIYIVHQLPAKLNCCNILILLVYTCEL